MRNFILFTVLWALGTQPATARIFGKPQFSGMYLQWGYNLDKYSKSDIHFHDGANYDFVLHDAKAVHKPDFQNLKKNPYQLTIPQYSYRLGVYLNKKHTQSIELNFDHTKYVVSNNQTLYISGQIHGHTLNKDTLVVNDFVHFEHTNGANFYHINYVGRTEILHNKKKNVERLGIIYKAGAGVVIPKTDVTLFAQRLDNKFHVAGYVLGAEAGFRYYPLKKLFLEFTGKTGFANYTNVLTTGTGRANHHFFYGEVIGTVGYDINFGMKKVKARAAE